MTEINILISHKYCLLHKVIWNVKVTGKNPVQTTLEQNISQHMTLYTETTSDSVVGHDHIPQSSPNFKVTYRKVLL